MFIESLIRSGVGTDRIRAIPGATTSRCVVLTNAGGTGRTMRTAMSPDAILSAAMLDPKDMEGAKWCASHGKVSQHNKSVYICTSVEICVPIPV